MPTTQGATMPDNDPYAWISNMQEGDHDIVYEAVALYLEVLDQAYTPDPAKILFTERLLAELNPNHKTPAGK